VEIAKTLIRGPRWLLLDEPFAALDPRAVHETGQLLRHLAASGIGVLVADHRFEAVLALAHRVCILDEGLRLHARLAKPGHETIGPFSLGIPTFLELRQITATAESAVGGAHDFRADRGRWDSAGLLLEGPVHCRGRDVTFAADRVTISPTGTVRIGRQLTLARREGKCTRSVFAGSSARGGTVGLDRGHQLGQLSAPVHATARVMESLLVQ